MAPPPKKLTILITGCSPGGMGAALAIAFHRLGHHVFATARNPSKLAPLTEQGIQTLALDITSESSITAAVATVSSSLKSLSLPGLNILINNAATSYSMPLSDVSIPDAKNLFETNLWGHLSVTKAFLPLLLRSLSDTAPGEFPGAIIVNHTSVGSMAALPFQGIYNASKAALAMMSETMRLELEGCFPGLRVIDLKTAGVKTNIIENNNVNSSSGSQAGGDILPKGSIYDPAREIVNRAMSQVDLKDGMKVTAEEWADEVVLLLLGRNPPSVIWKGESAFMARLAVGLPRFGNHGGGLFEGFLKKMTGLGEVERVIKESRAG
ncbi:short-chain dehydrogenase [Rhypophila decipiens]|uniref:Short-chain dehydrogenase n=1 Tax=Rhypophila decipiens TaxID=261697 RepID=A0AAN7B6D2_9PEZI|nr:short-chain dehydrogenase [Rhypophila decipiens]